MRLREKSAAGWGVALAVLAAPLAWSIPYGPWMAELPADGRFTNLLSESDAVVTAAIRGVAVPRPGSDAPATVEALVSAVVKGGLSPGETIAFLEARWCGPTYRAGEERLLFLKRGDATDPTAPGDSLWSLCPVTGKLDCLLDPAEPKTPDSTAVEAYLRVLAEARTRPPLLQVVLRGEGRDLLAEVFLGNDGTEGVWFDPSRVRVLAVVGQARVEGELVLDNRPGAGWVAIPPGGKVRGAVRFPGIQVGESPGVLVTLSNDSVLYPRRCWTGRLTSAPVHLSR